MKLLRSRYSDFRSVLTLYGWQTPNSYGQEFSELGDFPAIYMFLSVDDFDFDAFSISYVGMSRRLETRISGHNILPKLRCENRHIYIWFKRTPMHLLRKSEALMIKSINPPWNINGKMRGWAGQ